MKLRMGLIKKKADWSLEDFDAYWKGRHGALAARAPGLRAYWQNAVQDRVQRGIDFGRGPWDFDGFSQLWFDDAGGARRAFADGALAAELMADEAHFLGGLHIVTADQSVVIEVPVDDERARCRKRISLIRRLPSLSEEDFRHEWQVHGALVRAMPGVSGYRQNAVIARERQKGVPCDHADLPIDGIVEMWFKDTDILQQAFASRAGQEAMAHAKTFLAHITAFLVEERRIV